MDLANDMKINVFYQDTDSMFLEHERIPELETEYKQKYGRDLMGDDLQNLQYDFKLSGVSDKKKIVGTSMIVLGKKAYAIFIEAEGKTAVKSRLKGVPEHSIKTKAKADYAGDIMELYKDMATGKSITFTLNPDPFHPSFKFQNNEVFTRPEGSFIRTVKF